MREVTSQRAPRSSDTVEVVVEAGTDRGSLALCRQRTSVGEFEFFVILKAMQFDEAGHEGERVSTFEQGLKLLDASPRWAQLWVIDVHPTYALQVLQAVEERLSRVGVTTAVGQALARWRRMCGPPRDR